MVFNPRLATSSFNLLHWRRCSTRALNLGSGIPRVATASPFLSSSFGFGFGCLARHTTSSHTYTLGVRASTSSCLKLCYSWWSAIMVHVGRSVENDDERRLSIIALSTIKLPSGIRISAHTFELERNGRQTAISRIHISEKPTFWSGGCTSRWLMHISCGLGFRTSFPSSNLIAQHCIATV